MREHGFCVLPGNAQVLNGLLLSGELFFSGGLVVLSAFPFSVSPVVHARMGTATTPYLALLWGFTNGTTPFETVWLL